MQYFLHGFGVFLGVVAGVVIHLVVEHMRARSREQNQIGNLKFELIFNVGKIDQWIEKLNKYRNAVNGDTFHIFFEYFDLSRVVSVTTNSMFHLGLLYKHLSHEQIASLLQILQEFSQFGERYINDGIERHRQSWVDARASGKLEAWRRETKPQVTQDIEFWEEKFNNHRDTLWKIQESLK